ncbi:PREDICTED: WAT1-related protein At5g47470 isoform X2 [Nelumbo nucifera]|uniref:WAT1-related protein n=1 Tax=Nelumbo nucifera TaxID=4432 RepID=A0A1U8AA58_NELNU|nr:PREDICTED: WAT1-related protein At5g47470 isoform X2 [Nelumbo nucifera]
MFGFLGGGFLEEVVIVVGLIIVQIFYSVYSVAVARLLSIGFSPLFLTICGTLATSVVLFPLSICFERVTLFQVFMLIGVKMTSPAIASAMPNLAPGLIFIIACCLGFERINPKCIYSKIKIIGTVVCITGAVIMSVLYGPGVSKAIPDTTAKSPTLKVLTLIDKDNIIGCIYLLSAVFILSCTIVLQAAALGDFPAPMSVSAITSFIGGILTLVVQLIEDHRIDTSWQLVSALQIIEYSLLLGVFSGLCTSFSAWAVKKRGPVFVSMFNPIGTVSSVTLSAITLGDYITLGSLIGMLIMFTGLYFVLWAKKNEGYIVEEDVLKLKQCDSARPLLS